MSKKKKQVSIVKQIKTKEAWETFWNDEENGMLNGKYIKTFFLMVKQSLTFILSGVGVVKLWMCQLSKYSIKLKTLKKDYNFQELTKS